MLTALWLVPALGGIAVGLAPRWASRWLGLGVALVALAVAVAMAIGFDPSHQGWQYSVDKPWISQYGIRYHMGVDGLSLWLLLLNAFLTVVALLSAWRISRARGFFALMLLLEATMAGVFLAADLLLFYVFWEAMLIPSFFLLWLWGEGDKARAAAIKFVLYTLVGSLLMLVGVIGEYVFAGGAEHGFDLAAFAAHPPSPTLQFGLFFLFGMAFAIKVPLFPFHSWLPDAYAAAPAPMLVTFAGVMGKTGAYAMLRILLPLFPHPIGWWNWNGVVPVLAVIAIAWGAIMAITRPDMKDLVAWSSVSHMGFIVVGIFAFNQQGQQGAVLQMVNHGLIIPALFLLVAWIAARTGTRDRSILKDLAPKMPIMAGLFLVVTLAALGLPGLNSFVGEFTTLLGAWQFSPWLAVVGAVGLLLAPVYMLRLFQGIMYVGRGPQGAPAGGSTVRTDIATSELLLMTPLILLMFLLGLYPYLLTHAMDALGYALSVPWK
ncbi:MAG TPA: NADH-quinone oxidoreductase subunit M [Candidatus Acidoferrales bacterium]|nr:NADH-quinone oxidoreductase subunit M [Candidatus Acidoferrales bacterium]